MCTLTWINMLCSKACQNCFDIHHIFNFAAYQCHKNCNSTEISFNFFSFGIGLSGICLSYCMSDTLNCDCFIHIHNFRFQLKNKKRSHTWQTLKTSLSLTAWKPQILVTHIHSCNSTNLPSGWGDPNWNFPFPFWTFSVPLNFSLQLNYYFWTTSYLSTILNSFWQVVPWRKEINLKTNCYQRQTASRRLVPPHPYFRVFLVCFCLLILPSSFCLDWLFCMLCFCCFQNGLLLSIIVERR